MKSPDEIGQPCVRQPNVDLRFLGQRGLDCSVDCVLGQVHPGKQPHEDPDDQGNGGPERDQPA